MIFLWFGEVGSTENTIEGDHGKSFASAKTTALFASRKSVEPKDA